MVEKVTEIIDRVLDGIDRDEIDGGWWETSGGVELGTLRKEQLKAELVALVVTLTQERDDLKKYRDAEARALASLMVAAEAALANMRRALKHHGGGEFCSCNACRALAAAPKETCEHEWVSARNEAVLEGEMCPKCGAMRAEGAPEDNCPECGSGILNGEHIANYPCSRRKSK